MKRVIVTGATSMIGVAFIEECIRNNVEVAALLRKDSSRLKRLPESDRIHLVECNLENISTVNLPLGNYDAFYHFAWANTSKLTRDDPVLQEKNIAYTLDAVKLAAKMGCKKFIFAGSQAEYGTVRGKISPETPVNPLIAYGMAKYAAGMLSKKLCKQLGMVHIWGRIFSVYGKYDNEGTMLVYAIDSFLNGRSARFSSGLQKWDYLNETDAGKMFYLLGEKVAENRVYCIANGESRILRSYIEELRDCFTPRPECLFAEVSPGEEYAMPGLEADVSDLYRDVDYTPQISFAEGIRQMISYRKEKRLREE